MRFFTPFLALVATAAALPSPLTQKGQYTEDQPWQISHLYLYASPAHSTRNSTIQFYFTDNNPGIAVNHTFCRADAMPGTYPNMDGYTPCANSSVSFKVVDDIFWVRHAYRDASLGPWPWGGVTNYGNVDMKDWPRVKGGGLNAGNTTSGSGSGSGEMTLWKTYFEMPVTLTSAK